jgi:hypothetical protein
MDQKVKYNESTINRPWGERPIDAPMVPIDLHAYTQQLMQEEAWQKNDKNAITVFKSEGVTLVLIAMHKDAEVTPASVDGTGIMHLQVLDGSISFATQQEKLVIRRGQMIALHEHIDFSALAEEETICLLTMVKKNNHVPSPLH